MMKLSLEYHRLAKSIAEQLNLPAVTGIHLPSPVAEAHKPDEFGFVFLADGSVGPFYTTLDDTLQELWRFYPRGDRVQGRVMEFVDLLLEESQVLRAVAIGAFNALSQHVMNRAGFSPVVADSGKVSPAEGDRVAVVGFIRPMIEKLLARGHEVLVLEKNPGRVEMLPGLHLGSDPAELADMDFIICTAATLINDSLDEILAHRRADAHLSLIGPSGSGLPDILFQHGVDDVGGFFFNDLPALHEALVRQESWGHAGDKYQLAAEGYPGIDKLLESIQRHQR